MTTVVVVRTSGTLAIAADSLAIFGDARMAHGHEANQELFRCANSWIDNAGHSRREHCIPPMTRPGRRVNLRNWGFAPVAHSTRTPLGRYEPTPSP
jgi:hypothetical protein